MQTVDPSALKRVNSPCPDVSVVIVNYNAGRLLLECLERCLPQVGQVVVVDNASLDCSIDLLESYFRGSSQLQVIRMGPIWVLRLRATKVLKFALVISYCF